VSTAPIPIDEAKRLEALRRYGILDTLPESAFDELTRLAAQLMTAPIACISFVDENRLWFKSWQGMKVFEIPREHAFSSYAILQDDLFIIEDATRDDRFAQHPLLKNDPPIRFFAGMPLTSPEGFRLGALAVLDTKPRAVTPDQTETLKILARQVTTQLELRRHMVDLARSVEDHKHTEEQLRNSEAFYSTLVESLPQHIFRKDVHGRFTFCNRQFFQLMSRRKEDVLGKTDYDFFPPELAAKYHRDDLRVINTLQELDCIEPYQKPDGEKLFIHVIKTPLYDSSGWVVGIQGIFWDVTASKRIEEALSYERDLLRALLNNIPDRIYYKDIESRFVRCSMSMALRLGVDDPQKVVGKNDFDFHPKELAAEFYADEQRIILTGRPLINKPEHRTDSKGQEIWSSVTKVPIYNQNGQITGIIGISHDITRLKQAERALQQAHDAALETARMKTQFLANMSHEFRTPMNAIVGMTDMMLDTRLTPEQREFLQTIRDSTKTLLGMINEILDYSKVESGKFTFEIIEFDLREAIESTLEMVSETAFKKGVDLCCWTDHSLPQTLRGDPARLRQVLANLLSNAVKFTEKGEVTLRVTREEDAEGCIVIRFAVRDTGIGIDLNAHKLIFDAFTQADGSTTRKYGGTGLGLAISKQVVELMHGSIGVESEPGKGSTFWFKLPFPKEETPASTKDAFTLAHERLLIISDLQTWRETLQHLVQPLQADDVQAVPSKTALETIQAAANNGKPFSLILLDSAQGQPDDAIALAQSIQANPALKPARLVMLTSLGRRLNPSQMQQSGIAACIGKPIRSSRFYDCLQNVLRGTAAIVEIPAESPAYQAPAMAGHVRILVAEDNTVNQRLAIMQLKKLGYNADAVGNGAEVLDALTRLPYDIILMDCQMPEMDGYEVTNRLRKKGGPAAPYIIALTANALQGDRERCLAAGMNDYLHKPLNILALGDALQRAIMKMEPAPRPAAEPPAPQPDALDYAIINSLKALRDPNHSDPLRELVELFLKDGSSKIQKIETALAANDAPTVASLTHSLKGSSNNLGARRLGAICATFEKKSKAGDLSDAQALFADLKTQYLEVEKLLLAELEK
jgi:two-component system, sensor histidine kinase and response regulator